MRKSKLLNLQLFADGGNGAAGGDGGSSAAGVTGTEGAGVPNPEEQRLRELGVPEDVLRKRAERRAKNKNRNSVSEGQRVPAQTPVVEAPAQPAPVQQTEPDTAAPAVMSWDDFMAIPENNKRLQGVIAGRLKTAKTAEANMNAMKDAFALLAQDHGQDVNNIDYNALAQSIVENSKYIEDRAIAMNVSKGKAKQVVLDELNQKQQQFQEQRDRDDAAMRTHFDTLRSQFGQLQQSFPNISLQNELKNEKFAFATMPGTKLTAEDAYWAANHKQLLEAERARIEAEVTERLSANLQSGRSRPAENGTSMQTGSVTQYNINLADRRQREEFRRQVSAAAARGEYITPKDVKFYRS